MFSAVALANHLPSAIARLTGSFFRHFSPSSIDSCFIILTLRPQTPSLRACRQALRYTLRPQTPSLRARRQALRFNAASADSLVTVSPVRCTRSGSISLLPSISRISKRIKIPFSVRG
jgi:hypothetical protein